MQPLANHLRQSGWQDDHIATLSFADAFDSNVRHAAEIDAAVQALARAVDDAKIAVVAHSMGGLALRWYLAHYDAVRIRTAIFLATPHRGTWMAWLGWGVGCAEMRPSSPFLRNLAGAPVPEHVRCISFRAPWDTRLLPPASAWLHDSDYRTLPAYGHKRILRQRPVFDAVVAALEEE